jgi:hypothetical protein
MVNASAAPPVKVPAVIVMVNTPAAEIVEVPAPPAPPAVKLRVPGAATASPAPLSVMTILPVGGIRVVGVRDTVMTTPVALLTALLRVMAGWFVPRGLWASEVSIHINTKITQIVEVNAFREWLIILVLLLTPAFRNCFCY